MTWRMLWKRLWCFCICCSLHLAAFGDDTASRTLQHDQESFSGGSRTRRIDSMCGPYCLWQVSRAFGKDYSVNAIMKIADTSALEGTTIDAMVRTIHEMGLFAVAAKTKIKALAQDPSVAILLLHYDDCRHYVILDKVEEDHIRVLDGSEFHDITLGQLKSLWKGHAILISNKSQPAVASTQRHVGISLQVLGGLIVLVAIAFSGSRLVASLQTRRHS